MQRLLFVALFALLYAFTAQAEPQSVRHSRNRITTTANDTVLTPFIATADTVILGNNDSLSVHLPVVTAMERDSLGRLRQMPKSATTFNPDPTRALWLSALVPGLGQIYNHKFWKLPIVVGAFVGLTYGYQWNNRMYSDYSRAYRDILDDDPNTRSYMDFYPPTVQESDLDKTWLTNALRNKRNYFRRYRDICIFSMIGVYLLNIIDAYVDASLAHFDISPDLSMNIRPAVMQVRQSDRLPSVGVQCAFNF